MSQFPPTMPQTGMMRPHRGVVILVLGILGLLLCVIAGIVAWVMGNGDLRAMDSGEMDPAGRGLTQAGKILGIVAVVLNALFILIWVVLMIIGVGAAAAGAAAGGGSTP
jgi:hypothetical protein